MGFPNIARIIAAMVMFTAAGVLVIFYEAAFMPVFDVIIDMDGFADSAWAGPAQMLPSVGILVIVILFVGVGVWLLISPVQRTRVEVEERRLRR